MASGTEYDVWMPLHRGASMSQLGSLGDVRLRYSASFKSERARLLSYLRPKVHVFPFRSVEALRDSKFARFGVDTDASYSWDEFNAYLTEARSHAAWVLGASAVAYKILFWKWPHAPLSLLICLSLQFLVANPEWLPSILPAAACIALVYTFFSQPPRSALSDRPPPLFLVTRAVANWPKDEPVDAAIDEEAANTLRRATREAEEMEAAQERSAAEAAVKAPSLEEKLKQLQKEVDAAVKDALDADEDDMP
eukprot:795319-Prymnesium_polylepis.1